MRIAYAMFWCRWRKEVILSISSKGEEKRKSYENWVWFKYFLRRIWWCLQLPREKVEERTLHHEHLSTDFTIDKKTRKHLWILELLLGLRTIWRVPRKRSRSARFQKWELQRSASNQEGTISLYTIGRGNQNKCNILGVV